jgi:hypothetical protein
MSSSRFPKNEHLWLTALRLTGQLAIKTLPLSAIFVVFIQAVEYWFYGTFVLVESAQYIFSIGYVDSFKLLLEYFAQYDIQTYAELDAKFFAFQLIHLVIVQWYLRTMYTSVKQVIAGSKINPWNIILNSYDKTFRKFVLYGVLILLSIRLAGKISEAFSGVPGYFDEIMALAITAIAFIIIGKFMLSMAFFAFENSALFASLKKSYSIVSFGRSILYFIFLALLLLLSLVVVVLGIEGIKIFDNRVASWLFFVLVSVWTFFYYQFSVGLATAVYLRYAENNALLDLEGEYEGDSTDHLISNQS